jgi:hypothetical protein
VRLDNQIAADLLLAELITSIKIDDSTIIA